MSEARTTPWTGNLGQLIEYATDAIVSKTLIDDPRVKVVLFAMSAGQSLSGIRPACRHPSTSSRATPPSCWPRRGTRRRPAPTSTCRRTSITPWTP